MISVSAKYITICGYFKDLNTSSYSYGTSIAQAHLPEYPIEYNTLPAIRHLTNLLKFWHCLPKPNSNPKRKYLCNSVKVTCKQHSVSWMTGHVKWCCLLHWINLKGGTLKIPWGHNTLWQWPPSFTAPSFRTTPPMNSRGGGINYRSIKRDHTDWK